MERSDLPGLIERACALLDQARGGALECEVGGVGADAVAIEALARLALAARRANCEVRLSGACSELVELIELIGLSEVLGVR